MSLTSLKQCYAQKISIFILMTLAVSLLQFCMASTGVNAEYLSEHPDQGHIAPHIMGEETLAETMDNAVSVSNDENRLHDCCLDDDYRLTHESLLSACPECSGTDDSVLQPLLPECKTAFFLLYITQQAQVENRFIHRHWQLLTEPRIYSSFPEIYLAKSSFLE